MRKTSHRFRCSPLAACLLFAAAGCRDVEHQPLAASPYRIAPERYCPGDTLTASFDFLQMDWHCPLENKDCSRHYPSVRISAITAFFPSSGSTKTFRHYSGSMTIQPTTDVVEARFDLKDDSGEITIPRGNIAGKKRAWLLRTGIHDDIRQARRIDEEIAVELNYPGVCDGRKPTHTAQTPFGRPQFSPNLKLIALCNKNPVPIRASMSNSLQGGESTAELDPGACWNVDKPGVSSGFVFVRPLSVDPKARCDTATPIPPAPLRTEARLACR